MSYRAGAALTANCIIILSDSVLVAHNYCLLECGAISRQIARNPAFLINKMIKEKQRVVQLMRRLALQPPEGSYIVSYNPWRILLSC